MTHRLSLRRAVRPPRRACFARRLAPLVALSLLAIPALTACDPGGLLGTAKASGPLDCSMYEKKAPANGAPLLLVLLDVTDNSAATATRVANRVQPYLDEALRDGSYIRLVATAGGPMIYSDCFHGDQMFQIKRNNSARETKDRTAASKALGTEISHVVQSAKVGPTGSATPLLAGINDEVATVRATPGVKVTSVTALVWSDLLGTGEQTDCLNVDGKTASVTIAEAVVKRCFETRQISSVSPVRVRFLGVNEGSADRPQQELARYLKGELCRRISSDCG
ncbi:hypothetical protein [Frankia sp. R82]|uniref:hypothetical protein n=1 Tax=Frankia sp. R82 TaxID=2950553 RepID=UPI002043E772|nr:hypothetical protein [Frankia sp. R82]MCM3885891.1 hypothetical protein [Frankia sp. R82]